jgi:phage baseplate assembly protein V
MEARNPLPADLERRLDNLIRLGTVAEVDHAHALCRVQTGGILTAWLPWVPLRAGNTRTWCPPTVGEQVIVLSPSGEPGAGVVLPAVYTGAHDQPSNSPDDHVTLYPDGARIAYNHATHALTVTGIDTATVQASTHVTVDCPESTITGNVLIKGTLTVQDLLTYQNGLRGSGGSGNGNTITGPITHQGGNLSSNDIVLHTHTHPGDSGGTTGGPQ